LFTDDDIPPPPPPPPRPTPVAPPPSVPVLPPLPSGPPPLPSSPPPSPPPPPPPAPPPKPCPDKHSAVGRLLRAGSLKPPPVPPPEPCPVKYSASGQVLGTGSLKPLPVPPPEPCLVKYSNTGKMHSAGSLKELELQAKQYASSQAADRAPASHPGPSTQPEYLSGTWQSQMPQPPYPGQYTGGPAMPPRIAQPSVMLPPGSSSFIGTHQQEPVSAQNVGMYHGEPSNPAVSFSIPVPYRPPEPCGSYFSPQQMRPHSTNIQPESHSTYFSPGQTMAHPPDVRPNQMEQCNAVTRPPQRTPARNAGPLVFMPSRRPSVEASISQDTSFGVKRGRSFPPARNIRSSRSTSLCRSFRGRRTAPPESSRSGFRETGDEDWNTTAYRNEAGSGKTLQGFPNTPHSSASADKQIRPPWLSYDQPAQSQRGPSMQTDCVLPLMNVDLQPTFSSEYCICSK